ncbi:uncharacterized protein LOC108740953 [Agrilus planipennis]|uniref:Uncharacterized protein LOC108740953 n=1 Tax=Agrilus planipennis TaxID=224129 RepID=A0A1W4X4M7_AGRPL|nr:uncharacterized protein LOC108740953 [Agrilus planipennis]
MSVEMFQVSPHDSNIYCIPSFSEKKFTVEIQPSESFQLGNALQSFFPLLEAVFDYLNCNDLKNCMLVNEVWKDLAAKILQKRSSVSWVSYVERERIFQSSKCFNYNNISKCIIFYDYHYIKLDKYICLHENQLQRMTFVEYISKEVVPKNIEHCFLSCSSVTPIDLSNLIRSKKTAEKIPRAVFQSVSLPEIPNVKISMFHCNPSQSDAAIKCTLSKYIKPDEVVKCLLTFHISNPYRNIEKFLNCVLDGEDAASLALGGGIIKGIKPYLSDSYQIQRYCSAREYFCITFQQNKYAEIDFNAGSMVVSGVSHSTYEFEECLGKLKAKCQNRTDGVAFRICCAAKHDKDMETTLFNKHFPKIPLLGIDVDGEIGWDTKDFQKFKDETSGNMEFKKVKRTLPEMQHQWSSIFVLLTWGKLVNEGMFGL